MVTTQTATKQISKEIVWVLGGGRFGLRAIETIQKQIPAAAITLVDRQPVRGITGEIEFVQGDGVDWLVEQFDKEPAATRIIPAIPLHLAAEWLKRKLALAGRVVAPVEIGEELLASFPNPYRLSPSQLAVSHADFLCPPHCLEPDEICTYTRQRRPTPLYRLLEKEPFGPFTPLIIKSRQFGAGVGGYTVEDLRTLDKRVTFSPNIPLLLGTACKCHGIVDGLIIS